MIPLRISRDLAVEVARAEALHGLPSIPDGTGGHGRNVLLEAARDDYRRAERDGRMSWALVLAEEYAEAMAEDDPAALRAELLQVAAVAIRWVQAIDGRQA